MGVEITESNGAKVAADAQAIGDAAGCGAAVSTGASIGAGVGVLVPPANPIGAIVGGAVGSIAGLGVCVAMALKKPGRGEPMVQTLDENDPQLVLTAALQWSRRVLRKHGVSASAAAGGTASARGASFGAVAGSVDGPEQVVEGVARAVYEDRRHELGDETNDAIWRAVIGATVAVAGASAKRAHFILNQPDPIKTAERYLATRNSFLGAATGLFGGRTPGPSKDAEEPSEGRKPPRALLFVGAALVAWYFGAM